MVSPFRAFIRMGAYFAFSLLMIPVQSLALLVNRRSAREFPVFYHRVCARILGMRVRARGKICHGPALFVANHVTYIDITVLASLIRGSFIAKAEVAKWPFFGLLARLQRTVFIERRGSRTAEQRDQLSDRLKQHENLILFAEGTSNDGLRPLPFKSGLFAAAQVEVDGEPVTVQPVSIAYTKLDGRPIGRGFRPYYAWYGDMDLLSHFWEWTGLGLVTVEVVFHPPVTLPEFGSRKELAAHCQRVVAASVAGANAGVRPGARVAVGQTA